MNSTRRGFLKSAGTSLAAVGIGALGARAEGAADDPYGGLRMGLQSYSLRHFSFDEAVAKVAELGLSYVEPYPGHLNHNQAKDSLSETIKRMEDLGVAPDAYGVTGFNEDEAAARKVFDFAKRLGLRSISADPTPTSFDMLDKLVEEYQIPVAIHNHGPGHQWGKPEVILDAIKDHHRLIGLCADTGHFLRADVDPIEAVKLLRGRVYGLHLKDFVSESKEAIVGDGKMDLKGFIAEMRAQDFDGACSIEYELNPEDPMADIRAGLSNIREAVSGLA